MKARLIPLLLSTAMLHAAVPAMDDAALAKLLDTPDQTQFTGAFARFLLELPPAGLPGFRAKLTAGLLDKKLPRRHAWTALGLTDSRWVETDAAGFIAACEHGLKEVPAVGVRRALVRLVATDPDEAVRVWRALKLDKDLSYHTPGLLGALAAKDPQRAIALFKELPPPGLFAEPVAQAMISTWLDAGIDVAWQRLGELPPPPEEQPHQRRVTVCAAAARQDPAKAIALLESVAAADQRAAIQAALLYQLGRDEAPLALALARRIDTAAAWQGFATRARFGSDEATLRQLLAVLPAQHAEASLTAFFTFDDPVMPAFPNSRVLALLPDAALRRSMIVAIAVASDKRMQPLPAAVADAAAAIGPAVLEAPTPERAAAKLLAAMLASNPPALLPWMLALSEAGWRARASWIVNSWPTSRLAGDSVKLLAASHPRERELGMRLTDRWWCTAPVEALPVLRDKITDELARRIDSALLLRQCGGDPRQALALLDIIPDAAARITARRSFLLWQSTWLPPREAVELVLRIVDDPATHDQPAIANAFAARPEPEIDDLLKAIPADRHEHRDLLIARRAVHLTISGHAARALALWPAITEHDCFSGQLEDCLTRDCSRFTAWGELVRMVAARPGPADDSHLTQALAAALAKACGPQAPAIAEAAGSAPVAAALAQAMKELPRPPAEARHTWEDAVELGLATADGRALGVKTMRQLAATDPRAALATLIKTGESALQPEFLQPVLRRLAPLDPPAAFEFALQLPPACGHPLMATIIDEWLRIDPRAACAACAKLPPFKGQEAFLTNTIGTWLQMEPASALTWIEALPAGPLRADGIAAAILQLRVGQARRAADLFLANLTLLSDMRRSRLGDLAAGIAQHLANVQYQLACGFLETTALHAIEPALASSWQTHLLQWFDADPIAAAAYLKARPATPAMRELTRGLDTKLPPRFLTELNGWQPALPGTGSNESTRAGRAPSGDRPRTLTPGQFAAARKAAFELPPGTRDHAILELIQHLLNHGPQADLMPLVDEVAAMVGKGCDNHLPVRCVAAITSHYLEHDPPQLHPFLLALATAHPALLESAAATSLQNPATTPAPSAQALAVLLLVPPAQRAALLGQFLNHGGVLPDAFPQDLLAPGQPLPNNDIRARVIASLAAARPNDALLAAVLLPATTADPLVRGVLAMFPDPIAAATAIDAIPDPVAARRARAWLDCLPRGNPAAKAP